MLGIKQLPELEFVAGLEQVEDNTGKSTQIAEVLVMPNSDLIDRTLKRLAFRERYGLQVLAIHRRDQMLTRQIGTIKLQAGDQLLLQGNSETIDSLSQSGSFRVLDKEIDTPVDLPRARLVVGIFSSVMALAALNLLPLQVAVMFGVFGVFVTGALKPAQAYRSVAWGAWILVCCMLALGKAIEVSGFADLVANGVIQTLKLTNPYVLLAIFFGLAMLLTQPMSNQAAAVIIIPIAIQTAQRLGFDPRTFAIMIAVGASCSFITPLEPACLMVYNPGNYRFFDFSRVGGLLTLIIFAITILMVPMLWPF
jgi:di/tricarboxylate transporter